LGKLAGKSVGEIGVGKRILKILQICDTGCVGEILRVWLRSGCLVTVLVECVSGAILERQNAF